MAEVQAVKSIDTINLIGHLLEIRFSKQISRVWLFGLNVGLRISDLLSIKFSDINNERLIIKESKTGKLANIKLNNKALMILKEIQSEHPMHVFLFQSYRNQQSLNKAPRPLSRRSISKAFYEVGSEVKIDLGTHSLRKTRGYMLYRQSGDLTKVMRMLRHTSAGVTLRYIGITQEDVDSDFVNLEI
jgi:integrase